MEFFGNGRREYSTNPIPVVICVICNKDMLKNLNCGQPICLECLEEL